MNAWRRQVSGLRPENPAQKSLCTCNVTGVRMSLGNPADKLPGAEGIKPFTLVIPQYGTAIAFQKGGKGCAVFFLVGSAGQQCKNPAALPLLLVSLQESLH